MNYQSIDIWIRERDLQTKKLIDVTDIANEIGFKIRSVALTRLAWEKVAEPSSPVNSERLMDARISFILAMFYQDSIARWQAPTSQVKNWRGAHYEHYLELRIFDSAQNQIVPISLKAVFGYGRGKYGYSAMTIMLEGEDEEDSEAIKKVNDVIPQVSSKEASRIIETREPRGVFYIEDGGVYIGIDNRTGDAWVEEFETKEECLSWLS